MRSPSVQFTVRGMMAVAAVTAVYLLFFRTDMMLGLWAIGVSLPGLLWTIEAAWLAKMRSQIMTIGEQSVIFVRVLMLTLAVYAVVIATYIVIFSLIRRWS
ncbi:hypothetical protein SAMN05444166_1328 [Singulisphaera sp. GP187]|uniref:hypothetical protein n=1 Tax=Singulisphaera sp. GP187 TaxID=1882752 RepID=UPI0009281FA9|nr:hypothetical protein [Singulisphaera sp. GP187]SIN86337.1 hypothetical protein SAMN05444166_1328 [Singulisphaera sp. GP187]